MTLIEMIVAMAASTIVLAAIVATTVHASRSFLALSNYDSLDRYSRHALDIMSHDIRQTRGLSSYAVNRLQFVDNDGSNDLVFAWDPYTRVLTRQKGTWVSVLLTNCDRLEFHISQRNPSNDFAFYPASDVSQCKLVDVSWKCSRTILGKKVNTESVQTAKIVIRN